MQQQLQCKSFEWFLSTHAKVVFKDFPPLPPNVVWGSVESVAHAHICLGATGPHPPATITTTHCVDSSGNQLFRLNQAGQLALGERCIEVEDDNAVLRVTYCKLGTVNGKWRYDKVSTLSIF